MDTKFRAWHFGLKRMFSAEEMTEDQMALLPDGHFANIDADDTRLSKIYSHEEMLPLQFTGLLDKTNKEIYEGDVLQYDRDARLEYPKTMIFEDGRFVLKGTDERRRWDITGYSEYTVIGNVYENPELVAP